MRDDNHRDYPFESPQYPRVLSGVILFVRRQKWILLWPTMLLAIFGAAYVITRTPTYTARARLVVENTRLESSRNDLLPTVAAADASVVDSQVEIIKTEAIALKAIETLGLTEDPSLWRTPSLSLSDRLRTMFQQDSKEAPPSATDQARLMLPTFQAAILVKRIGLSSVIEVGFKSPNSEKSAQIVNEVVHAYLADQAASAVASAAPATAWLRERIKDVGPRTRLVSSANAPTIKDGPGAVLLLSVFTTFGALCGLALSVVRAFANRTLQERLEGESRLGASCLGAGRKFSSLSPHRKRLAPDDLVYAAKAVRYITKENKKKSIGVIATTPGEGATTFAKRLAHTAASDGALVLLVDANLDDPELSRQFAPDAAHGLTDVLTDPTCFADVVCKADSLGVHFLPAGGRPGGSSEDPILFAWIETYDYVVFDLPPLVTFPRLDVPRGAIREVVLVVEWGKVTVESIESGLRYAGIPRQSRLGFIFNKVLPSKVDETTFPLESYRWKRGKGNH